VLYAPFQGRDLSLGGGTGLVKLREPGLEVFEADDPFGVGVLEPGTLEVRFLELLGPQLRLSLRLSAGATFLQLYLAVQVRP
jgi:hypothetical protein